MRRCLLPLAALALLSACNRPPERAGQAAEATGVPLKQAASGAEERRPRLVLLLVVDQMPSWSFSRDAELTRGGIRRLLDGGVYYPNAEFPFASTYTAPGHAALGTGATPAQTGILANGWYARELGAARSVVHDEASPVFVLAGDRADEAKTPSGASSRNLRVDGVADVLRREVESARSVSLGLKRRAAIPTLGRRPDLVVWYAPDQPAMTTSRFYRSAPPDWLARLAKEQPISNRFGEVWEPLDTALLARETRSEDAAPGESEPWGLDRSFPHPLDAGAPHKAILATPIGTDLVLDTAEAAIAGESLGADEVPDLLAITFSSHDYAGHAWGPRSWERLDLFLRLDRRLGAFFDFLDRRVGKGAWAAVLTSDHGATPLCERSRAAGREAGRVKKPALLRAAEGAAASVLGEGTWTAAFSAGTVYMSDAFSRRDGEERSAALDAVTAALRALPNVGYAERTKRLVGDCDRRRGMEQLACRSLDGELSGEVFVAAARYSILTGDYDEGTSHGSPNPEDRTVPIIVYGPGRGPAVIDEPVSPLQVAATLSDLLGISPPPAALGAPL